MISTVLNETKLTPAKILLIPHSYYICQFPAIFRLMWAFAFFSILYPEKNIRLPHGHPTTL